MVAKENNQQRNIQDHIQPIVNDNYYGSVAKLFLADNFELMSALIRMVMQN